MIWNGLLRPSCELGSTVTRSRGGASTSVLVIGRTVTTESSLNRSDCTTSAGRGLPCSLWRATVTRSPLLTPSSRSGRISWTKPRRQWHSPAQRHESGQPYGHILQRNRPPWCPAPNSAPAAARQRGACHAVVEPAVHLFSPLTCVTETPSDILEGHSTRVSVSGANLANFATHSPAASLFIMRPPMVLRCCG